MYQFFVEPGQINVPDRSVVILGRDVNHIKNVLRMKIGGELNVSNGQDGREYRCAVAAFEEDRVLCELRFVKEDNVELPSRIYLFQALPKADKMELIIQKAVELGVYRVIPVEAKRCVVKLDERKTASRLARWQGIAEAAAKQSKRAIVPEIEPVLPEGMGKTRELFEALRPGEDIAVFIGPEGGFETSEIELAMENGIEPITLGRRILRTETAGMTVLSWLVYRLEGACVPEEV